LLAEAEREIWLLPAEPEDLGTLSCFLREWLESAVALVEHARDASGRKEGCDTLASIRKDEQSEDLPQLCSAPDLARRLGLNVNLVDSFLRRLRGVKRDCYVESDNPRKNEPRYLYRTADIWPELQQQLPLWRSRKTNT